MCTIQLWAAVTTKILFVACVVLQAYVCSWAPASGAMKLTVTSTPWLSRPLQEFSAFWVVSFLSWRLRVAAAAVEVVVATTRRRRTRWRRLRPSNDAMTTALTRSPGYFHSILDVSAGTISILCTKTMRVQIGVFGRVFFTNRDIRSLALLPSHLWLSTCLEVGRWRASHGNI